MYRAVGVAILLVLASCGGDGIASATGARNAPTGPGEQAPEVARTTEPTSAPEPTPPPAPTAIPTPEGVTDEELIDAAQAAFEDDRRDEFVAWDFLDAEIDGDVVTLTVCAWTGFNAYDVTLAVEVAVDAVVPGVVGTRIVSTGAGGGDCLNQELIDSALAFIDEHDEYWRAITSDPTTFDPAVRAPELLGANHLATITPLVQSWAAQGAHWEGLSFEGNLPDSAVQEVLWRSFDAASGPVLEVLACRDMDPRNGFYQGDELLEGGRPDDAAGDYSITTYRLARADGTWRLVGGNVRIWANCFFEAPWVEGMNSLDGDPVPWKPIGGA